MAPGSTSKAELGLDVIDRVAAADNDAGFGTLGRGALRACAKVVRRNGACVMWGVGGY